MKNSSKVTLMQVLHYVFGSLLLACTLLFLLTLLAELGFNGKPCVKGWVTAVDFKYPGPLQSPDGARLYRFSGAGFYMKEFDQISAAWQWSVALYFLAKMTGWLIGIWVLYQLMRLFRNLHQGLIFREENIWRMRSIGVASILFPVAKYLESNMLAYCSRQSSSFGEIVVEKGFQNETAVLPLLVAVLVFALVEIFRAGFNLQQEQDLTI